MGIYTLAAPLSTTTLAASSFQNWSLRLYGRAVTLGERTQQLAQETGLSDFLLGPDGSRRRDLLARTPKLSSLVQSHDGLRTFHLQGRLSVYPQVTQHPHWVELITLLAGPTSVGLDGHPRIHRESFQQFLQHIPHVLADGAELLDWLDALEKVLPEALRTSEEDAHSMQRAIRATRTMINTASVTAPPDMWLLRQILSTHEELGLLQDLNSGMTINVAEYAARNELDERQLGIDLEFLFARGYLDRTPQGYVKTTSTASYVLEEIVALPTQYRTDMTGELISWFKGETGLAREELIEGWLGSRIASRTPTAGWTASTHEIEIGYRVVPLVLALNAAGLLKGIRRGREFNPPHFTLEMKQLFEEAGILSEGKVTSLGLRMLRRGPGPFGIIGTYHTYTTQHTQLLQANGLKPHVQRGPNVAASRDANRRDFENGVRQLEKYFEATDWQPTVVIEHALGHGVAIQEFVKRFGADGLRFFGFDYEAKALDAAKGEQAAGTLPANMTFAPPTDIAKPERLIKFLSLSLSDRDLSALSEDELSTLMNEPLTEEDFARVQQERIVMIVGAGFHEARLDDDALVEKLKLYRQAGILMMPVEASALTTPMQRASAWQSYNAGFTWVHETSGQRLRSPVRYTSPHHRHSWPDLFQAAGYRIEEHYSQGTRPLFPYVAPRPENPPISYTFLAVPRATKEI